MGYIYFWSAKAWRVAFLVSRALGGRSPGGPVALASQHQLGLPEKALGKVDPSGDPLDPEPYGGLD